MAHEDYEQLYHYIKYGKLAAVEKYLDDGGDVNLSSRNNGTLLIAAAFKGNARILTLLLDRGANIDAMDKDGETALHTASGGGHVKCVKILLARGANTHLGWPLPSYMIYAKCPSPEINQLLADAGAV